MGKVTSRVEPLELILEKSFGVSTETLFDALTQSEHLRRWWAPGDWELTACEVDFRVDGSWFYAMKYTGQTPGDLYGTDAGGRWLYREIDNPRSFTFIDLFADAHNVIDEIMPQGTVTMLFADHEEGTRLTVRMRYDSEDDLNTMIDIGMEQGMGDVLERLEAYLI